ncbi:hypothetical protein AAW31_07860 [Nitrosomonas communis]|uniref:Transposase IS204/IS1001/IS1096/IS1165 DDE domain-containing protein n=1 Tax=Nitrosomonas communis TaxID=44574 RepID=A0A0F7KBD5_9PROT|nr:hypothetical protein AAW31_07860 [Nitrosomonas communis]
MSNTKKYCIARFDIFVCNEVNQAGIPAFQAFAHTVTPHWNGIIHLVESCLTNGILENINNKIQLTKQRARGYRNINNFINMIYFYVESFSLLTHGIST